VEQAEDVVVVVGTTTEVAQLVVVVDVAQVEDVVVVVEDLVVEVDVARAEVVVVVVGTTTQVAMPVDNQQLSAPSLLPVDSPHLEREGN